MKSEEEEREKKTNLIQKTTNQNQKTTPLGMYVHCVHIPYILNIVFSFFLALPPHIVLFLLGPLLDNKWPVWEGRKVRKEERKGTRKREKQKQKQNKKQKTKKKNKKQTTLSKQ